MNTAGILLGSIAGTLGMSLYGAFISSAHGDNFQTGLFNLLLGKAKSLLSWVVHYGVALGFTIFYDWLWRSTPYDATIFCGLILGLLNGVIAILLVRLFFERGYWILYRTRFFLHVMVAHGVFGMSTVMGYNLISN
jgi:hypothetical protein